MLDAADLGPAEEGGQGVLGGAVARLARGRGGLVEREEGEVAGVEQVGGGVVVGLDEGGLGGAVGVVRGGRMVAGASGGRDDVADGAARILRGEQVARDAVEPGPVPRRVVDAHEPRQGQEHLGPLLLEAGGVDPAVGIGLHGGRDRGAGPVAEGSEAGVPVGEEVAGPHEGLVVRRQAHRSPSGDAFPARRPEFRAVDAVGEEARRSGEAQIGGQCRQDPLVVAVGAEHPACQQHAEDRPRLVVAVIDGGPVAAAGPAVLRRVVPADEAEGRGTWIGTLSQAGPRAEEEPVADPAGHGPVGFVAERRGRGRHGAGRLAVTVGAPPPAHRLRAVGEDRGVESLEHPERAVARRGVGGRAGRDAVTPGPILRRIGIGYRGDGAVGRAIVAGEHRRMDHHPRAEIPVDPPGQRASFGVGREGLVAREARPHRRLPHEPGERRLGHHEAQDAVPHRAPGGGRGEAAGGEAAQLRRRHEPGSVALSLRRLEEDGMRRGGQPVDRRVEARHAADDEMGRRRLHRQEPAAV